MDKNSEFLGGGKLPCILVENKIDLLDDEENNEEKNKEFKEFGEKNGFDGAFRTSVKVAKNIHEALDFLILDIIKRYEDFNTFCENIFKEPSNNINTNTNTKPKEENKSIKEKEESIEENKIKCSFKEHEDKEASSYCYDCQIYLCDKCADYHKGLWKNHKICLIDEMSNETFTGLCKEENHNMKLEYYCKNHNKLCCGLCICKIKANGKGQHNDCNISFIKDIKEEKKNKIKNNIKTLKEISNELDKEIKNIKISPERVKENKDKMKLEVKDIFEKIKTELNNRENILSSDIDKYLDEKYFIDKKRYEIKSLLSKFKSLDDDWEDEELKELINNCIKIENKVKEINNIKENIEKNYNKDNFNIRFNSNINTIITKIKKFGCISDSKILKRKNIINKFNELINDDKITNNMTLLYRSSRDGLDYLNIIKSINNKSNLLFLYLTENNKIFGAYINTKLENIDFNGTKKYYKDENAFVFSINNNKKYKILIPENAIAFDNKNYILIGNNDNDNNGFYFSDKIIEDKQLINGIKIYDFSKNSELTEGSGKLIELEIFGINQN